MWFLRNEWQGLDGMVIQKNPDENVNHLPSAASCVVDGITASGDSLDAKRYMLLYFINQILLKFEILTFYKNIF